jgi:hypothetical protein
VTVSVCGCRRLIQVKAWHQKRLAAAFAVVASAVETVLYREVAHSLNGASTRVAALHSDVAELVHAEQGVAAAAARTGDENACGGGLSAAGRQ